MLRIMSFNANGIRLAHRKGFFEWFAVQYVYLMCIQETKVQVSQLSDEILARDGYRSWFHDAEKKGYAGVAVYSRREPEQYTWWSNRGQERGLAHRLPGRRRDSRARCGPQQSTARTASRTMRH